MKSKKSSLNHPRNSHDTIVWLTFSAFYHTIPGHDLQIPILGSLRDAGWRIAGEVMFEMREDPSVALCRRSGPTTPSGWGIMVPAVSVGDFSDPHAAGSLAENAGHFVTPAHCRTALAVEGSQSYMVLYQANIQIGSQHMVF